MRSLRRKARFLAIQAAYQWQFGGDIAEIVEQFCEVANPKKVDLPYFKELLIGLTENLSTINQELENVLDRSLKEINPVELSILRVAVYELLFRVEIPYRVIIDEALELSKIFASEEAAKYINGVLDKIARKIRQFG